MHSQHRVIHAIGIAIVIFLAAAPAAAQLRAELVASGFDRPVVVVADPLTPKTFIVVEQRGVALAMVDGVTQPTPFLDLTSEVKFHNEQGFIGLTFSPDGTRVFVSFTKKRNPDLGIGDVVVARFRRSPDPLVLDTSSRFDLIWPNGQPFIFQPTEVHKGGNLAFGPDGYLYIGLGDGGGFGSLQYSAQAPMELVGKMLRLDVNVSNVHPRGYVVPPDNPFVDRQPIAALPEIWSFGFRNPWRWSFDDYGPGATGALIVGDVGLESREEIDYEPAGRGGRNYGWYLREGGIQTPGIPPDTRPAYEPLTNPMVDYPRSIGSSVTGGYIYRGSVLPPHYRGRYFLADFFYRVFSLGIAVDANGEGRVTDVLEHTTELGNPRFIPTFARGLDGELYLTSFQGGRIYKIVTDTASPPPATPTGLSSIVNGSTVNLSWQPGAGGGPVFSYQIEVGSQSGASDLLVTQTSAPGFGAAGVPDGLYFVRVRAVNFAGASDASAEIAVRVGCVPPATPTQLTSQVAVGGFVSLTWGPVAGAAGYFVEAGASPGAADLAVIPVSAASIGGVVPSRTYYVRVRARNACGVSAPSSEVAIHVP